VHLDPSTTGAALFVFGPLTVGSLLLLLGLCVLPALRDWKETHAEPAGRGNSAPPLQF
jgi:hypothetical protein